jgi:peptide-methionine (S)-S-oxide reductase
MSVSRKANRSNSFTVYGVRVACASVLFTVAFGTTLVRAAEATTATFAGGCFWCVESDFDHVPGVQETISGYTGGHTEDPTYKSISDGRSGHREAVQIRFDPAVVTFAALVKIFLRSTDPTDGGGQFCDRGFTYTTAIYTANPQQEQTAKDAIKALTDSAQLPASIATVVQPGKRFYPAEDYHQNYYMKNPLRYKFYRFSCGRDARVKTLWGDDAHYGIKRD